MIKRHFSLVVVLAGGLWLSGCAVESSRNNVKVDEAVTSRVAAGLQYLQQGNPSEARRHFSRALSLNDNSAKAHNAMALLYNYERDPENEERHYNRALRIDGDYAPALNNYGTLLYSQGRYQEALKLFGRVANDPGYEGRGSAYSNIGLCHLRLDQPEEAKEAFIKALRLQPRSVTPNLELARLYYQEQRYDLGWDYYQQYTQRVGRQDPAGLWLGVRLAHALGRKDQQSSYELALQNLHRGSREYRLWQEWRDAQEAP
ncbi:type IV pilus assembly protein PilF [Alloalcanivorax xenomutans]|uniref:type IV pilus biogenesis/stability protein PilW n=1 Tax=Alloalcanivorax xenomutans TaxID=1094342 RepID=UPI000BD7C478|nr:type IV pilus biogenesis/stability protein PilW [Alloalcanivorax xenomutans]SOC27854.1 type IV pilus assembly protein PilF [Alloalcanivorax xenomutans]